MDKQELAKFEQAFLQLPPRRREVLLKLLAGETDEEIAQSLSIHLGTVRNQISKLCDDFQLKELPGERRSRRADLIALVAKYNPELLGFNTSFTRSMAIHYELNLPASSLNPFVPLTGVVDEPRLFFNREQEIRRVFEILNSSSSVAVIGERGIGKSSLLLAICRYAESYLQQRQPVYLNLQPLASEDDFYSALSDQVEEINEKTRGYHLVRALRKRPLLIAIDEVENEAVFTSEIRSQLRGLAEGRDAPVRLVLAASQPLDSLFPDERMTSPLAGICLIENLKAWDENTARAFIANRLNSTVTFSEEKISQLIAESGGHPQRLMQLCHETYARYIEEAQ